MFRIKLIPNSNNMFGIFRGEVLVKGGTKKEVKQFIEETNSKPHEYRGSFYCSPKCTECCQQHVTVTETEIFKIRRHLRSLDSNYIHRLKTQDRNQEHCPLLDVDKGTCSVYEARPDICKAFGCHTGALACSYNLDVELKPVQNYFLGMLNRDTSEVGRLGVDFTWDKGLIRE